MQGGIDTREALISKKVTKSSELSGLRSEVRDLEETLYKRYYLRSSTTKTKTTTSNKNDKSSFNERTPFVVGNEGSDLSAPPPSSSSRHQQQQDHDHHHAHYRDDSSGNLESGNTSTHTSPYVSPLLLKQQQEAEERSRENSPVITDADNKHNAENENVPKIPKKISLAILRSKGRRKDSSTSILLSQQKQILQDQRKRLSEVMKFENPSSQQQQENTYNNNVPPTYSYANALREKRNKQQQRIQKLRQLGGKGILTSSSSTSGDGKGHLTLNQAVKMLEDEDHEDDEYENENEEDIVEGNLILLDHSNNNRESTNNTNFQMPLVEDAVFRDGMISVLISEGWSPDQALAALLATQHKGTVASAKQWLKEILVNGNSNSTSFGRKSYQQQPRNLSSSRRINVGVDLNDDDNNDDEISKVGLQSLSAFAEPPVVPPRSSLTTTKNKKKKKSKMTEEEEKSPEKLLPSIANTSSTTTTSRALHYASYSKEENPMTNNLVAQSFLPRISGSSNIGGGEESKAKENFYSEQQQEKQEKDFQQQQQTQINIKVRVRRPTDGLLIQLRKSFLPSDLLSSVFTTFLSEQGEDATGEGYSSSIEASEKAASFARMVSASYSKWALVSTIPPKKVYTWKDMDRMTLQDIIGVKNNFSSSSSVQQQHQNVIVSFHMEQVSMAAASARQVMSGRTSIHKSKERLF